VPDIYGRRFDADGVPLSGPFQVSTLDSQFYPRVSHDGTGGFVVVYAHYPEEPGDFLVLGQRFDSSGAKLGAEFTAGTSPWFADRPDVSHGPDGSFVVVWEDQATAPGNGIFLRRYDVDGNPFAPPVRVSTAGESYPIDPRVSHAPSGEFVVTWTSGTAGREIFAQRHLATGAPTGAVFQVNETTQDYQGLSAPSHAADGSFVVAWSRSAGILANVLARRFSAAASPLAGEFEVNVLPDGSSGAAVSHDADARFVITWGDFLHPGNGSDVYARRFDADATPISAPFVVNTATASSQFNADVAMRAGRYVVVWSSYLAPGLLAQIFATSATPGPSPVPSLGTAGAIVLSMGLLAAALARGRRPNPSGDPA